MNKIAILLLLTLFIISCGDTNERTISFAVHNPTNIERESEFVLIDLNMLKEKYRDFNIDAFRIFDREAELPYQIIDNNFAGFALHIEPAASKRIKITYLKEGKMSLKYPSKTYAEIAMKVDYDFKNGKYLGGRFQNFSRVRIPDDHTDHNALFKYEGPGWESDKVGYRLYIDWRNRIDIFGKKTNDLVLSNVGINDLDAEDDSYHYMQEWGKDIFKVGSSLGIGSFGMMVNDEIIMVSKRDSVICEIIENGPVQAAVKTDYFGWEVNNSKYDLSAKFSINAGSRLTDVQLTANNNPENFVTGFAKHANTEFSSSINKNEWSYISLYGVQTAADYGDPRNAVDNLGIAVFFLEKDLIRQTETDDSYVLILKPTEGKLNYYFAAAWEQEPEGIKTYEEFINYLEETLIILNQPLEVIF